MSSGLRSLTLVLLETVACAEVIGLGAYEKSDDLEEGDSGSVGRSRGAGYA